MKTTIYVSYYARTIPSHQLGTFSARLRYAMCLRDYTAKALADQLQISRSTVSGYCNGSREPNFDTLRRIARELHVRPDYLLGFSDYILLESTLQQK